MDQAKLLLVFTQVATSFFEKIDKDTLVHRILDAAIALTKGDRGAVFLAPDGSGSQLVSMIATGMSKKIEVSIDQGVVGHVYRSGLPTKIDDAQNDPLFFPKIDKKTKYKTKTIIACPIRTPQGRLLGVIEVLNSKSGLFSDEDLKILEVLSLFAAVAFVHFETRASLSNTNEKLKSERLERVNKSQVFLLESNNPSLSNSYKKLPAFAESDSSVLIEGESGTGKEVIANALHSLSSRREGPFIAINCAAIPESLFEAELFGVAKGAATGTLPRKGKLELAHQGTLFLDEIGELPQAVQAKLLRVLQEKVISPLGSEDVHKKVDFRIVSATNRNLLESVSSGRFREDLYYRINVLRFELPPLRERTEDISDLLNILMEKMQRERGWKPKKVSKSVITDLKKYHWPGNIRELQNKLEGALINCVNKDVLSIGDFQFLGPKASMLKGASGGSGVYPLSAGAGGKLNIKEAKDDLEKVLIKKALEKTGGNKTQAAKLLGISREGLRKAQERYRKVV